MPAWEIGSGREAGTPGCQPPRWGAGLGVVGAGRVPACLGAASSGVQPCAQVKPLSIQSEEMGKLHRLKKGNFIFLTSCEHWTCISLPLGALATAVLQHQALNIYLTSCRIRTNHSYFPSKLHFHLNVIPSVHAQPYPARWKGSSEALGCTHSRQRWGVCLISSHLGAQTGRPVPEPGFSMGFPLGSHSWRKDPTSNNIACPRSSELSSRAHK